MATIIGTAGDDTLVGTGVSDSVNGRAGADSMTGGGGSDVYYVDNAGDSVIEVGGEGDDRVYVTGAWVLGGGQSVETLLVFSDAGATVTGNELANRIYGGGGIDILTGGGGDDLVYGRAGDDILNGGTGSDTLFGEDGADTINGDDGDDELLGGAGDDVLRGGSGSDRLNGGSGADDMRGGIGNDRYIVNDGADTIGEIDGEGFDVVSTTVTYTLSAFIEQMFLNGGDIDGTGNAQANFIWGSDGDNGINGADGNDTIYGWAGDDVINGGAGADRMNGNDGNDTYYVDDAGDLVIEQKVGFDTVIIDDSLSSWSAGGQLIEAITLVSGHDGGEFFASSAVGTRMTGSTGSETFHGSARDDVLIGGGGNDFLFAGIGNDVLDARGGTAEMAGGRGQDIYYIGSTGDVITELTGQGDDTAYAGVTYRVGENVELLVLTGTGDIDGFGAEVSYDRNEIIGNSGANRLDGDWGNDKLTGGAGADSFVISHVFESGGGLIEKDIFVDVDFSAGDRIDLSAVDANSNLAGDQAFVFVEGFSGAGGEAVLVASRDYGYKVLILDINGDKVVDHSVTIYTAVTTEPVLTGAEPSSTGGWLL
jgi:serralysin